MRTLLSLFVLCSLSWAVTPPSIDEILGDRPWSDEKPVTPACRMRYLGATDAESLHSYDVRHYRVDINLPMTDRSYDAHLGVCIKSEVPSLAACSLHFVDLVCDSVKRSDGPLSFSTPTGLLDITLDSPLPQGDSCLLDIFFHRESTAAERGYFFARPPTVTYVYAMTCTPPKDCRYWMPCWDEPFDKPERGVMLNITVPDTFQTCANGLLDSVTTGTGTKTYWWNHPYPIATYLINFAASHFVSWHHDLIQPNGDTVPSIYFMWPQDSAVSVSTLGRIPEMFDFYSDTAMFGPYPFEKYGMVPGYYGFPWGGMENQTLTMIHTSWLRQGYDDGMAHELSHMWYGDMVTCVDFRNIWLNEGFATWAECLYHGHAYGRASFNSYIASKGNRYFTLHRTRDFPIYDPAPDDIYNTPVIYNKGSWIMRMLQFVYGDTAWENRGLFFQALRAYGDSFKYGTASTEDFQRINEQVSGQDLDWFFDEWVYDQGYPRYFITWDKQPLGDSWLVSATLTQRNDTTSARLFHMPYPVRFNGAAESTLVVFYPQDTVALDTFLLASEPLSLTPDPDNWVLDSSYVTGVEEAPSAKVLVANVGPSIVRGVLFLGAGHDRYDLGRGTCLNPPGDCGSCPKPVLLDISGRKVLDLHAGRNDVSRLAPGVYFVVAGGGQSVTKVVVAD
jgi:aminopeptidase N